MKVWRKVKHVTTELGQSLVETALVLPILIVLLVGIVELSNVLNTQNKLTTASRNAADFGAANYDRDNFSMITAPAMGQVALNTVTETLIMDTNRWDIWSIKARTNGEGTAFSVFTHTKVFGDESVLTVTEWDALVPDVQSDMLAALRSVCDGGDTCDEAADIEVVASVPYYAPDPILGLPVLEFLNLDRQHGLTVMRVGEPPEVASCPLLPIAIRLDQWSLYPSDWYDPDTDTLAAPLSNQYPGHDVHPFPPKDRKIWEWPTCDKANPASCQKKDGPPIPTYTNGSIDPFTVSSPMKVQYLDTDETFWPNNVPGTPLGSALAMRGRIGYIFWAREQVGDPGNFGWLSWDGSNDANKLADSLAPPIGDFMEFYPGSRADMGELTNLPPGEKSGNGNNWLEIGEWVEGAPGNMDNAGKQGLHQWIYDETLQDAIIKSKVVPLVVFDQRSEETGSKVSYRVAAFVIARILGYSFGGSQGNSSNLYGGKWIVFEMMGRADVCYDVPEIIADGS
jgi:hypothetical protein